MHKKAVVLLMCLFMLFASTLTFASPVNLPEGIKDKEGLVLSKEGLLENVNLSISFLFDNLSKRKLKQGGKVKAKVLGGKIALSLMDRLDIYTTLGQINDPEFRQTFDGSDVKFELEDKFIWSVGLAGTIYEWEDAGIQLFGDGNYRRASGMDYKAVVVDGTRYTKSELSGEVDAKWEEWQVAFGVSKKFKYFIPYVGVKYSDVKASAKATAGGIEYGDRDKSKRKVGPFLGVSIVPIKGVAIDLSGRFVDEQAFSVITRVKF